MSPLERLPFDLDNNTSPHTYPPDFDTPPWENNIEYTLPPFPPSELPVETPADPTSPFPFNSALSLSGRSSNSSASTAPPSSRRFDPIRAAASRPRPPARGEIGKGSGGLRDEGEPRALSPSGGDSIPRTRAIRKLRIESEQKRRDELRDGYARLKETLPPFNQPSSKVSLLDRATSHIRYLELKLKAAESEIDHLRSLNETLMLNSAQNRPRSRRSLEENNVDQNVLDSDLPLEEGEDTGERAHQYPSENFDLDKGNESEGTETGQKPGRKSDDETEIVIDPEVVDVNIRRDPGDETEVAAVPRSQVDGQREFEVGNDIKLSTS